MQSIRLDLVADVANDQRLAIGGAAFLLWRRRRFSVVYNIDPAVLDEALAVVCSRLKLELNRSASRLLIGTTKPETAGVAVRVPGSFAAAPLLGNGASENLPLAGLALEPVARQDQEILGHGGVRLRARVRPRPVRRPGAPAELPPPPRPPRWSAS